MLELAMTKNHSKTANIADRQPAITVYNNGSINVMRVSDLRRLANGAIYDGNKDYLVSVLSRAVIDLTGG